ncbi:MAG: hypothetical protein ACI4OT_06140 [Bacilli bacterium]
MKNKMNKENLEQEIRDLEKEVYNKTGYKNDRPFLKTEYEEAKKEYKRDKRKVRKIKGIRNLKVTGYVSLMLLPFVVSAGVWAGGSSIIYKVTEADPVDLGDEVKIISMDSLGNYEEELNNSLYKENINVKTRWFEEDGNLVRYTYEATEGIDFHSQEEVEEAVNTDYFELIKKYDLEVKNKDVVELTDERLKSDLGTDEISIKADVQINEEEKNKINSNLKKYPVKSGIMGFVASLIPWIIAVWAEYDPFEYAGAISNEVDDSRYKLKRMSDIKAKKKKVKELKKKLK